MHGQQVQQTGEFDPARVAFHLELEYEPIPVPLKQFEMVRASQIINQKCSESTNINWQLSRVLN